MSPVTLKERTVTVLMLTTCRVGDAMAEIGMGKKRGRDILLRRKNDAGSQEGKQLQNLRPL